MGCISEHRESFDTLRLTEVSLGSDLLLSEFVIFRTRIFALAACWTEVGLQYFDFASDTA